MVDVACEKQNGKHTIRDLAGATLGSSILRRKSQSPSESHLPFRERFRPRINFFFFFDHLSFFSLSRLKYNDRKKISEAHLRDALIVGDEARCVNQAEGFRFSSCLTHTFGARVNSCVRGFSRDSLAPRKSCPCYLACNFFRRTLLALRSPPIIPPIAGCDLVAVLTTGGEAIRQFGVVQRLISSANRDATTSRDCSRVFFALGAFLIRYN